MAREMKDSGIPWIGEIPAHWELNKLKTYTSMLTPMRDKPEHLDGDIPWIRIEDYDGKYISTSKDGLGVSIGTVRDMNLKVYPVGTILCTSSCDLGKCAVVARELVSNQRFIGIIPNQDTSSDFLYYLMLSNAERLNFLSTGSIQANLSRVAFEQLYVQMPTYLEQQVIASYLDKKCAEIDAVLKRTYASIEEYKKLKQTIITQAVTKGVRGDRPMKESGIEWIDAIPEEIKVSRLGLHYDIILGKMLCSAQVDNTYTLEPYYCAADVHFEGISDSERKMMWFSPAEKELYLVQENDLLVVEGGAGAGGCAIVVDVPIPTYIQNSIMIVRPKHSGDCRYLRYLLECYVKQGYIDVVCNKATIPHFTKDKLACVPYPVFSQQEKTEIADYLDIQNSKINEIIAKKEQHLLEIERYKKSLIYEYVTGKKEVGES